MRKKKSRATATGSKGKQRAVEKPAGDGAKDKMWVQKKVEE